MPAHTVGEMIALLSEFPPETPLLVDGYEFGLRDPDPPQLMKVRFNVNKENSYSGKHEVDYDNEGDTEAVVIGRESD